MATDTRRTSWSTLRRASTRTNVAEAAYEDEARVAAFRELVCRLRTEAGLTQAELAARMGTTQSAIARIEGGGTRPSLDTLEKLAVAVGADLIVGVRANLSANRSIAKLERDGHAVVRRAGSREPAPIGVAAGRQPAQGCRPHSACPVPTTPDSNQDSNRSVDACTSAVLAGTYVSRSRRWWT